MRKISEMYRISGGTNPDHRCEECCNFITDKEKQTCFRCRLYKGSIGESLDWRKSYPACRWFNQTRPELENDKKSEDQVAGQISLEDYFGGSQ